jgi:hypothetical protein
MQVKFKYSYNAGKCSCGEKTGGEMSRGEAPSHRQNSNPWTNFSLQDEPWAEFSTSEVAACVILYALTARCSKTT